MLILSKIVLAVLIIMQRKIINRTLTFKWLKYMRGNNSQVVTTRRQGPKISLILIRRKAPLNLTQWRMKYWSQADQVHNLQKPAKRWESMLISNLNDFHQMQTREPRCWFLRTFRVNSENKPVEALKSQAVFSRNLFKRLC